MSRTNSLPISTSDLSSTLFDTSQPEPPTPLQPPQLPQPPPPPKPSPSSLSATKHPTPPIAETAASSTDDGSNPKEVVNSLESIASQETPQVANSSESKTNGLIVVSSTPSFSSAQHDDKISDSLSDQLRQHPHHHHHHHHQGHHHHHHQHHQHHHHQHQGQGLKRQRSIKTSWYLPNWEASAADTLSPAKLGGTQKQRPLVRRTYSEASTSSVLKQAPASIAGVATTTTASAAPVISTSTLQSETLKFDYSLLGKESNIAKYAANDKEFRKTFLASKDFENPTNVGELLAVFESSTTKKTANVPSEVECCGCCSTFPCSCEPKKSLAMMSEVIVEEDSSRRESEGHVEVTFDERQNMATFDYNGDSFIWTRSSSSCESSDEGFMMNRREERRDVKSLPSSTAKKTAQRPSSMGAATELGASSDDNYKEKSPLHEIARKAMEIATTIADGQQDSRSVASAKEGDKMADIGDSRNFINNSCRPKDEAKADKRIDLTAVRCETADEEDDAMDEISLMHSRYEKIPMTDFSTEIRASVDVENFLSAETSLILDAPVSSLEAVVECLLRRTLHAHEMFTDAFQDAKKSFFIQDSVCQLSRTIQNRCRTSSGKYEYEQSWLCILGSLATIQRRNVAIARLKNATNLGKTSRDVRFVILVVTPTKEKGTKNALELGRTFSTLFADTGLRLKLLAAESEFEFKLSLRQHVKQLSRSATKTSTEGEEMASPVDHQSSHQSPHHHHHHHHRHHHHHQQLNHQRVSQPSGEKSNLAGMGMVKKRFGGSFKHPNQKALTDQVRRIKSVRVRRKLDNSIDRPLLQKSPQLVLQHFDLNSHNSNNSDQHQQQQQQRQSQQSASSTQHMNNERDSFSDDAPKSRFSKRLHLIRVQHHSQQQQQPQLPSQQQQQQKPQQQRQPVRLSQHKKSIEKRTSDPGRIELIDDSLTQRHEAFGDDSSAEASPTQKRVPSLQLKHKQLKQEQSDGKNQPCVKLSFCDGIKQDLRGRLPHYLSDFTDGLSSRCALRKTATTSFFLYFACLLPSIAIGTVNYDASGGYLDVKKTLCSQTIGGLTFALFGGQPMIVLMATVPLALYTKIVYAVSRDLDSEFEVLFAWTSLWNAIFLLSYALLDLGRCMKFSTRSIEEVFAMFIAASMIVYAFKDVVHDFRINYYSNTCLLSQPQSKRHDIITAQNQLPFIPIETMNYPSTAQLHPQFDWAATNKTGPYDSLTGAHKSDSNNNNSNNKNGNNKSNSNNNDRILGNRVKRLIDVIDHHHRHHHRSRQRNDNNSKTSVALPYETHKNNNNNNNNNKSSEAKNKLSRNNNNSNNAFGFLKRFSSGSHDDVEMFDYSNGRQIFGGDGFASTSNRNTWHTSGPDWRRRRGLSKPSPPNGSTAVTNPANIVSDDNSSNNTKEVMKVRYNNATITTTNKGTLNKTPSSLSSSSSSSSSSASLISPSSSSPSSSSTSISSSSRRTTTCTRENSLLCLLLTLATLWLSVFLYNFTKTPFLNASKRSLLADGALPVSVILLSVVGSYIFVDVKLELVGSERRSPIVAMVNQKTSWFVVLCALPLGFLMSLLFFIDQAVVEGVVSYKENRLKKSQAINWDLFIISLINIILAFTGLPLVQPSLPQTPLHVHALADLEDRVDQGKVNQKIISVRETRVTALATHLLIGATIAAFEVLRWIPRPVLDGLLLHLAVIIMFRKNQLFDRILLLVTEQASYPPTHYIRTVPQRTIHLFTCVQLIQLLVLCCLAFSGIAYLQLAFPLLLILLLPMRYKLFTYLFEKKYLVSLDGN